MIPAFYLGTPLGTPFSRAGQNLTDFGGMKRADGRVSRNFYAVYVLLLNFYVLAFSDSFFLELI